MSPSVSFSFAFNICKSIPRVLSVLVCSFIVANAVSAAIFQPGPDMSNERRFVAVVAGDIDGDGDIDLITAVDSSAEIIQRRINDGTGKFTVERLGKDYNQLLSIALGDIDGDGDLDVIVGTVGRPIKLYLNDGLANFSDIGIAISAENFYAKNIALIDIDADGDLDLVVNDSTSPGLFINNGRGHFADSRDLGIKANLGISFGFADVDGDSDVDLIASKGDVYLNDGKGNFTLKPGNEIEERDLGQMILVDVDGDGDIDIVSSGQYGYALYLNAGNGLFALSPELSKVPINEGNISAGDVDGDGDLDLLFGNSDKPDELFLNNGKGHFTKSEEPLGAHRFVLLHDVDRDQDLDVISLGRASSVLLNQSNRFPGVMLNNLPKAAAKAELKPALDLLATSIQPPPLFLSAIPLIINQHIDLLAAADINDDGHVDLAISSTRDKKSQLRIYLNNGKGELGAPMDIAVTDEPTSISFADINNDNFPDLLVSYSNKLNGIYLNNAGRFDLQEVDIGLNVDKTKSILAVDINADGALDLITANYGHSKRYLNDGAGHFTSGRAINREPSSSDFTVAADIDGDGNLDLIQGARDVKLYTGNGDATFNADAIELLSGSSYVTRVFAGDLDGDGDIDLLSCSYSINMLRNNGQRNFSVGRDLNAGRTCALADIDADGDLDIVTAEYSDSPISILLNDGQANWASLTNSGETLGIGQFILVDMDGDGDLDLLGVPYHENALAIFPNIVHHGYFNERVDEITRANELKKQPQVQPKIEAPVSQHLFAKLWRALKEFNDEWNIVGVCAVLFLTFSLYRFLRR
jgi:hypothetical protein